MTFELKNREKRVIELQTKKVELIEEIKLLKKSLNDLKNQSRNFAINRTSFKNKKCQVCGVPAEERHHIDYNKPREIVFLCKKHHHGLRTKEFNFKKQDIIKVEGVLNNSNSEQAARKRIQRIFNERKPCVLCGVSENLTVRHVVDNDIFNCSEENIKWLCTCCLGKVLKYKLIQKEVFKNE